MKFTYAILLTAASLILGLILGVWGIPAIKSFAHGKGIVRDDDVREAPSGNSHFTSPLLECGELSQSVSDTTLSTLHTQIQSLVDTRTSQGEITYASVYFRDLNNGPWFGVNESDEFFPASLLKLPLAMSFFNVAEDDPTILDKKVTYVPDPSIASQTQPFGPQHNVQEGKVYTIKELLDIMLKESSNEAAVALAGAATPDQITEIYHDLGLKPPQFGKDYKIDIHKYASFFRILYNATYLDRSASEKLLSTLSEASFQDGLVAGVPNGVAVAHKFGSRQVDTSGKVQLHDCGIVYAKNKPYILCVMTQGTDFTKLAAFIREVSKQVYAAVASTP